MCSRATCRTCGKATYSGCGSHVEQVLAGVPSADRCRCREERIAAGQAPRDPGVERPAGRWSGWRRGAR